ncbi:MAG TPA: hypothetical protein VMN03_08175 [Burkholderiales bacterium]|nr:hypothetical protein [Burkholderiales bacterium]
MSDGETADPAVTKGGKFDMHPKSEKPLRLFVNPFAVWTDLALKTGEAMLTSAHAATAQANALRVAVIPTADAPPPKARRTKVRSKAKAKRRAKR